ncbi:hypothetical protein KKH13_04570 [Patescibacteria group bacterium]|uniref:Glycosyltransferase n=1 Tax=viral metagenome TaxID=1070528 RepID=A0A6M3ISU0_9ZZZZ|nr:hypothetical protein [Patescibacteria group bacterium]
MREDKLLRLASGIDPWIDNFGEGMERRGQDGMSWYDLSINLNSAPCLPELAIIVTSYHGQLKWLSAVLKQYRLSGAFVILAYDNPFYPWMPLNPAELYRLLPNQKHYLLANSVVMKHITYDSDKRNGWFWDVRYAQGVIKNFKNIKYVYITNGDCICEKPEGFKEAIKLLGDYDLTSGQSMGDLVHTATIFAKVEAFHKIFDWMAEEMRVPVLGSRSPEGLLRQAINAQRLNFLHLPVQPRDPKDGTLDAYARYDQDSTWKRILGFKNLFAIYETLGNEGKEPLDKKYVDGFMDWIYFGGEERETLCQFWETGDRRYLYMWLDRWEDSDYNRLYTDLNYYSLTPVFDKSADKELYREIK